jgi:hypothetical protein
MLKMIITNAIIRIKFVKLNQDNPILCLEEYLSYLYFSILQWKT